MAKTLTIEIPVKTATRLGVFLKEFIVAVDQARKQMRRDQVEINRLKAETRTLLAELKALR